MKIQGRITVTTFKTNPAVLGHHLANLPQTRAKLLGLAHQTAQRTRGNLLRLGNPGSKVIYPRFLGRRWSAKPAAVARLVTVKDLTREFPLRAPKVVKADVTRVALVISDHPYSWPYEFGGMGIRASGFMRQAVREVASKSPGVKLRKYRRPEGAP